ncbi:jg1320 [Pararge aegeria aegeria]|uniref:Jg1320 protein n=1 Tax=Pararge aegeria aegeria TaxID=348720 RepID=A0A8S4SHJ7_9NEOP|nr:jg1320 [Pararge aegeria aegeria]
MDTPVSITNKFCKGTGSSSDLAGRTPYPYFQPSLLRQSYTWTVLLFRRYDPPLLRQSHTWTVLVFQRYEPPRHRQSHSCLGHPPPETIYPLSPSTASSAPHRRDAQIPLLVGSKPSANNIS